MEISVFFVLSNFVTENVIENLKQVLPSFVRYKVIN